MRRRSVRGGKIAQTHAIQAMRARHAPGDLATRFDLAETLLLLGEFERGWRKVQHRYSLAHTMRLERKVQRAQGRPADRGPAPADPRRRT